MRYGGWHRLSCDPLFDPMKIQAFILIALSLLAGWQGRADSAPVFELNSKEDEVSISFSWDPGLVSESPSFEKNVITLLKPGASHPGYARVLSIDSSWRVASLIQVSVVCQDDEGEPVSASAEGLLDVHLAHMGRRAFLRIEIDPFGAEWPLKSLDAVLRLSSEEPIHSMALKSEAVPAGVLSDYEQLSIPVGLSGAASVSNDFAPRKGFTNDVAWKIPINEYGLYRLSGAQMAAAGVPESVRRSDSLRLTCRDREVPFWTSAEGAFQSNDVLRFFAVALDSEYSTQNVYWLTAEAPGLTTEFREAAPKGTGSAQTTTWTKVVYDQPLFFKAAYQPLDESFDHWFSMEIYGGTSSNLWIQTPHPVATGEVEMAYSLRGVNEYSNYSPDHLTRIYVDSAQVVSRSFDGEKHVYGTTNFPISYLHQVATPLQVSQEKPSGVPAAGYSSAYLKTIDLTYERLLVGDSLPLYITGRSSTGDVRVVSCADDAGWVLDLTDPLQAVVLTNYTWAGAELHFSDTVGAERFFGVFGTSTVQQVDSLEQVRFRDLASTARQATYLLVAPESCHAEAYRLLKHRFKNDWQVQVASPEEVYNSFSYGVVDPLGLQQYIGYAWHHYASPPESVLLVGSGSYDPLQRTGHTEQNTIPVVMGAAPFRRTSLPQWYACINGEDWLPDVSLGLIPITSATEFGRAIDKMIDFAVSATGAIWRGSALLVADDYDGQNAFKSFCVSNTTEHLVQAGFDPVSGIQTAYLDDLTTAQVRQTINGFLNSGGQYLHYMGHGSVEQWAAENIWSVADVTNAVNTVFPVFTVFTCQSGAFHEPDDTCLAEAVLSASGAGSACVAPTALSIQDNAEDLADGFYGSVASNNAATLGEAMQGAFLSLWNHSPYARELRIYTVFGDPALPLKGGAQP